MKTVRESLLEIAARLSDQSTWEDVMYQIYVHQKIEIGLADLAAGRTIDHEVVIEEITK